MLDQREIADEIRARYAADERLPHPAEIAVAEREGKVILRGTLRSFRQRQAAIDIARSVRGVRAVSEDLVVDPRDHWQDEELRGAALQALMSRPDVPADDVDVKVADRWLTLKGQVRRQDDSDAAFDAVARLPGVGGITNEIKVVTAGGY